MSLLLDTLRERPIVLDAAMGTRLIAQGLDLVHDDPCLWNLTRPDLVRACHHRDLDAGADAVLTNTFGANRHWLARFGRSADDHRINFQAVALAREAAGPDRFVLGDLGPTGLARPSDYVGQAEILMSAGVDALILETHTPEQALDGLDLLRERWASPILVGLLLGLDAFLDPGGAPNDTPARLQDRGAGALGVNCVEPRTARVLIGGLERAGLGIPLMVLPSASSGSDPVTWLAELGLGPGAVGSDRLGDRVRLLGGCCGTDHRHVGLLREAVDRQVRT